MPVKGTLHKSGVYDIFPIFRDRFALGFRHRCAEALNSFYLYVLSLVPNPLSDLDEV